MIVFKYRKLKNHWKTLENINPQLVEIVKEVELVLGDIVITSIFRNGDPGVHGVWRGVDVRANDISTDKAKEAEKRINTLWTYDPSRSQYNVALLHGEGSNRHLHLQNHPKTSRQEDC